MVSALLVVAAFALSFVPASAAPKVKNSCSDTDGGIVITVFGTTSGYYKNNYYSHSDYCVDSGTIKEYYCSGVYEQSTQQSCGTDGYSGSNYCISDDVYRDWVDYFCTSGACSSNSTPILQQDCGTDGYVGSNYCLNGSVYRDWRDIYCASGVCGYIDTPTLQETCEYGCTAGVCNGIPDSCSDSDGGNFPSTFGTASGYLNESYYSDSDYCVDSDTVKEYYCSGVYEQSTQQSCGTDYYSMNYCINSSVYNDFIDYYCSSGTCGFSVTPELIETCEYGCLNGMCTGPPDSCNDTDGGFTFDLQGTVSGLLDGDNYSYTDTCINNVTLSEWYCSGAYAYNIGNYTCNWGNYTACLNGACI
jgi:hypothetical protein